VIARHAGICLPTTHMHSQLVGGGVLRVVGGRSWRRHVPQPAAVLGLTLGVPRQCRAHMTTPCWSAKRWRQQLCWCIPTRRCNVMDACCNLQFLWAELALLPTCQRAPADLVSAFTYLLDASDSYSHARASYAPVAQSSYSAAALRQPTVWCSTGCRAYQGGIGTHR
jgi:hypothetical protein